MNPPQLPPPSIETLNGLKIQLTHEVVMTALQNPQNMRDFKESLATSLANFRETERDSEY